MLAGNQLGQVAAFLLVIAVAAELIDAEIGMGAIGKADRSGSARNLLDRDAMFQIAQRQAAIFLRRREAVEAERPHFGPEVPREKIVAIDRGGARRDLGLGEFAC